MGRGGGRSAMRNMRIVQTPVRFWPAYGGVEKYVLELSKHLVAQGNDVTVVCADEPQVGSCVVQGVKTLRLPYRAKVANTNITPGLFRTLIRSDFDVIHTHIPTPWSADVSALVSLMKRKPLVVTYHNDLSGQGIDNLIASAYNATFLHIVLWRAKSIIITQPRYIDHSRHLKFHRRKIVAIPLGVSEPLTISQGSRKPGQIFFMSVLDKHHEYKGLDVLLQSMVAIRNSRREARLLVGGGGELIKKYLRVACELGISDSVEFLGYVPDKELAELYSSSALFVLPSVNKMEGFGIVALEALSYATPVITTEFAGSSEFIKSNKAGLVVPSRDSDALAKAILTVLEDDSESKSMGVRGAEAVNREFGWDKIARQVTGVYL